MTARDELARIIESVDAAAEWDVTPDAYDMYADAVLAAGYSKPRVITTAEELDALPVGSVIRTSGVDFHTLPRVAVKTGYWLKESEWEVADSNEWIADSTELDDLPVTVLHEGDAA